MHFETKQILNGSADEVEAAMLDERYLQFLLKNHGVLLQVESKERRVEGNTVVRKVRYLPRPVIQSIGPKKVPPEWFAFIENSTYDRTQKRLKFTNIPTNGSISKLLVNTGSITLKDLGGGKSERTVEGEIKLLLPFLLKPLGMIGERVIQSEGLKILDGEVPVLNRFIAETLRKE